MNTKNNTSENTTNQNQNQNQNKNTNTTNQNEITNTQNTTENTSPNTTENNDSDSNSDNSHNKRIAILGGSFDPPTLSHITAASEIYNTHENIDEVWLIPCGDGRKDKSLRTLAKHRLAMLKLILNDILGKNVPVYINDIEIRNKRYYPTAELLQSLKDENPDKTFIFCMGTDLVSSFRNWENGEKLAEEQEFILLNRVGYTPDKSLFPVHYSIINGICEASSTRIRDRIKNKIDKKNKINLGINGLTTSSVIQYIKDNKLYQG